MNLSQEAVAIVGDFGWFVENFDTAQKSLSFVHTSRPEIERQSFLDPRWQPEEGMRRQLAMDAVIAALARDSLPRLNFIWHTSFCCSTLLARALDRPGRNLSLREPLVLVPLADAWREGAFARGSLPALLPDAVFRLLARRDSVRSQVTVKPSNFTNVLIREAARLSAGNVLFLYSDLSSFLVSVLKGGLGLHKFARHLFWKIAGDSGQPLRWTGSDLLHLSDLEIAALSWHMQIAEFRRDLPVLGEARAATLDCAAFLADPAATLRWLDEFFGLDLGEEHLRSALSGPLFEHDAKFPDRALNPITRDEQARAIRQRSGNDIDRVVEWSYRVCPDTPPAGAPLPNALL